MVMQFDAGVSQGDIRRAVAALKNMRGKSLALDFAVDRIETRKIAHVAEEALRAEASGGLWRYTGADTDLISRAIAMLNFQGARNSSSSRTRLDSRDDT